MIFSFNYRLSQLQEELVTANNINLDGKPDAMNPDLLLHEQIDFIPYDKKYEFPKEKLKLGNNRESLVHFSNSNSNEIIDWFP